MSIRPPRAATNRPRIAVLALGGTIAMVPGDAGVKPGLGADDLIRAVPGIDRLAELTAETFQKVGSYDLTVAGMLALAAHIDGLAKAGRIDGAIITQGTDTIEETAFLLDCVLDLDIPVIVIGAMRNPLMVSPDGSGNLMAAVKVAADPWVRAHARALGVLVVMLDHVHAAAEVRKVETNRIDAFTTPYPGPLGTVIEGRVRIDALPRRDWKAALAAALAGRPPEDWRDIPAAVALLTIALDDSGGLLAALAADPEHFGYGGVVLAGMGGGHVPGRLTGFVSELTAALPVVMAGRAGTGYLLRDTYEPVGAEKDLQARGVVWAGRLHPLKARVLLTLMLMAGLDGDAMAPIWEAWN